jgi:hypothetical protein
MGLPVVGKAHEVGAGAPFVWFIYGSSLDRAAFEAWAKEHGYRVPDFSRAKAVRLDGYRLAFDVNSRFWGGATASLTPAQGERVEGLALPMPGDARGLVDHKEGAISGLYEMFPVKVVPLEGGDPIEAVAYRSNPSRRVPETTPSRAFLETVVKGAHAWKLSAGWIAALEALALR